MIRKLIIDRRIQLRHALNPWWMKLQLLLLLTFVVSVIAGIRINVSESLPLGIYRVVDNARDLERGSTVIVCLPETWSRFALQRRILRPGNCPGGSYGLGKIVVAVAGDRVTIAQDRLLVGTSLLANGKRLDRDNAGRAMPRFPSGRYTLLPGEIWLYSCHPSAFDSRYFGPVTEDLIVSIVKPVLVESLWYQRSCEGQNAAERIEPEPQRAF